jgi:putative SOS response-associated peptidase YedK
VSVGRYFEWLKKGKERIPYFTKHKGGQLMLMAGLYDIAHLQGPCKVCGEVKNLTSEIGVEEPLISFTIVTTSASSQLSWLHDRQPVILTSKEELDTWLDTTSQTWDDKLVNIIKPHDRKAVPKEKGMELEWWVLNSFLS